MKGVVYGSQGHFNYVREATLLPGGPEITGVCAGPEDSEEALLTAFPGAHAYTSPEEMLLQENPDFVCVSPAFFRTEDMIALALEKGLPVFADKPLSLTLAGLRRLETLWEKSSVALGCMFGICNEPWFRTVKAAVEEGSIGNIRLLQGQKSYKLGTRPDFYRKREKFGGLIPWVGIHALDWLLSFGGEVKELTAFASSGENRGYGDLEMTASVQLLFASGAIGSITADYFRPSGASRHDDDRLRLTGTEGVLEARDREVWLTDARGMRSLPLLPATNCCNDFLEVLSSGNKEQVLAMGQRAFTATRIALLAREAADSHRLLSVGSADEKQ